MEWFPTKFGSNTPNSVSSNWPNRDPHVGYSPVTDPVITCYTRTTRHTKTVIWGQVLCDRQAVGIYMVIDLNAAFEINVLYCSVHKPR